MQTKETMRVFIADDSDLVRSSLKDVLSDLPGVKIVGEAARANNLVGTILRLKPDVVILDLRMPGGNGFSNLRQIKKAAPWTYVMIITEFAFDLYRRKCLELGADYFFEKSLETERLVNVVGRWAGNWGRQLPSAESTIRRLA